MANRHLSRSIVMQTLFEWDFNGKNDSLIEEMLLRNTKEFAPGMGDFSFMKNLTESIISKSGVLDEIIEKAAPDWPIERISAVDRNILRIGLFELLFAEKSEVPPKVAINEAIELAKTFGGENSGKFVNGVLGAVYKEMGEPGKDEVSKKKNKTPIDLSKIPLDNLVGAIVYEKREDGLYLALVHDIFGHWTLSKGHLKEGETEEQGVVRKVKEELGLESEVKEKIGENEYLASDQEHGKIRKHVSYFIAEAKSRDLYTEKEGGLDDSRWFKAEEIVDLNIYDDILPLFTKAIGLLVTN